MLYCVSVPWLESDIETGAARVLILAVFPNGCFGSAACWQSSRCLDSEDYLWDCVESISG